MIEYGVVVSLQGDTATISTQRQSACASCSANKACGTGLLSETLGRDQTHLVHVPTQQGLDVGQTVSLVASEKALLLAAFLVYGLPLLVVLLLAAILHAAGLGDGWIAVYATLAFGATLLFVRRIIKSSVFSNSWQPAIKVLKVDQTSL